ncbi:MAG: adenosylcobinamide-phosphate synthase CbiB, partial [Oscillospiraceae bacterium]
MEFIFNNTTVIAVIIGFTIDAVLGDPQNPYHPIRFVGFVISKLVALYNKLKPQKRVWQFIYGMVMAIFVVAFFYFTTFIIVKFVYSLNVFAGIIFEGILCYFIISAKALYNEGVKIYKLLSENNLESARKSLSYIVGRDTQNLNAQKIVKATIETISENLSDGGIAPLIFLLIGGAPLGMAYKAVNTLDSMVAYKNKTYQYLGKFSARLDDVVNLIPARLSALFMIFATIVCGKNVKGAVKIYIRDRHKHLSPNSAHTEAVCAGALNIQLGGASTYNGKIVEKPTIGDNIKNVEIKDIKSAIKLMYTS